MSIEDILIIKNGECPSDPKPISVACRIPETQNREPTQKECLHCCLTRLFRLTDSLYMEATRAREIMFLVGRIHNFIDEKLTLPK